jgi:hypothetical protein
MNERPDPRAVRATFHAELSRLRELGVALKKFGRGASERLVHRFADEFVEPDRREPFVALAFSVEQAVDFVKWLRVDRTNGASGPGTLEWLAAGAERFSCVRIDRRARLPVVEVSVETLDEAWVTSWPGAYVNFPARRTFVVTPDYEVFRCDLRDSQGSPYR